MKLKLMFELSFFFCISKKKPGDISIFRNFIENFGDFLISPIFHEKSQVSQSFKRFSRLQSFWYAWIEEINAYLLVPKPAFIGLDVLQLSLIRRE